MLSVERLSAHARLDQTQEALARARSEAAAGDESWEEWVVEYERGQALILALDLKIEFAVNNREPLTSSVGGCFVEVDSQTPKVEQQIAELASGEFVALGEHLGEEASDVDELGLMYVHVHLQEDLQRRIADLHDA